jgi:hypothetical protein
MSTLGIGSTIWRFDGNYRVYAKNERGLSTGGPIYREHWRPVQIVGETSRSWVTSYNGKAPKKGLHHGWAFTPEEVEDDIWFKDHRHKIRDRIDRLDVKTLRAVAALIGYQP